jgi:N-acetylmuramoyl-L-alanine amidase
LRRRLLATAISVVVLAAIGGILWGPTHPKGSPVSLPDDTSSSTTTTLAVPTTAVPTTTTTAPVPWPAIATSGEVRAVTTPTGVVLPVVRPEGDRYVVTTPCNNTAVVAGTPLFGAHVVLDAGHGGNEPGAVGPSGLTEKEVNLAIAQETKRLLEARGATVVLTRSADYRIALVTRAKIATRLAPTVFLSIHHNAEPDAPHDGPGGETYYQIASPDSKRLAGLVYEELIGSFRRFDIAWVGELDAGAKYRRRSDGGDYYGILSRTAGVPAVLSEAAFISSAPEERLLATPDFRLAEAEAFTKAIVRYVSTRDPGSGFVEPYPRTVPAGPGGGTTGCVDPPL